MTSAQARRQNRSRKKRAAEETSDGVFTQAIEGVVDVAAQLMTGAAQAVSGMVEAASPSSIQGGGGDFGGGGATGGWELPSISLPNISLPEIEIDF